MHEAQLVRDLIAKVAAEAQKQRAVQVRAIEVWRGALCHCTVDQFADLFVELSQGTVAEGAQLLVHEGNDPDDPRAAELLLVGVEMEVLDED